MVLSLCGTRSSPEVLDNKYTIAAMQRSEVGLEPGFAIAYVQLLIVKRTWAERIWKFIVNIVLFALRDQCDY